MNEERMRRYEADKAARVAAAEARRWQLNDAAVARLMKERTGQDWERGAESAARPSRPLGRVQMVCPHCGERGRVTTRQVKVKRGVSGGKATGAVLTGGWSLLATGLARKERVTAAHCGACGSDWMF